MAIKRYAYSLNTNTHQHIVNKTKYYIIQYVVVQQTVICSTEEYYLMREFKDQQSRKLGVLFDRINTKMITLYKYATLFMAYMVGIVCCFVLAIQNQTAPKICLLLILLKMVFNLNGPCHSVNTAHLIVHDQAFRIVAWQSYPPVEDVLGTTRHKGLMSYACETI